MTIVEFDPVKDRRNIAERGFSLGLAQAFDFDTALIKEDKRFPYTETRYQALGMIGPHLYFLAFTLRGEAVRVISLRKANIREVCFYAQETRSRTD
ncbi:BrnT family toxin [Pusillimonas noertemannii]|uniref:Uncharacterized protein n=1 Tax=Pusillimonas noertemannii TaxID=305977 RepID=A0A2U1CIW7_9BURK|nr:BrnT family toxin [Pusillimonas noertemannii]NYT69999.1 BrnT family toxin [Pusillimonas noertemannii]PVY60949.1 hypothetical protein C7440_3111 [Pusillimonas noertemannii]TFL08392.1 BrnT family toxin [Pusillimonas noertemannii]